jgi:hypothetical protein
MTIDDLYRLWSQAGGTFGDDALDRPATMQISEARIFQFFTLMRDHMAYEGWRQCANGQKTTQFCGMVEQARLEERAACARACEELERDDWRGQSWDSGTLDCAAAIRARRTA